MGIKHKNLILLHWRQLDKFWTIVIWRGGEDVKKKKKKNKTKQGKYHNNMKTH